MNKPTRRHLLTAAAGCLVWSITGQARAERIPLDAISAYLNTIRTAEASFTQINADGTLSTGKLFLQRPGRARFVYDPPNGGLVIAGGSQVAIFDDKSNTAPEQFPLAETPLSIILAARVDLGGTVLVAGHSDDGTVTSVIAQDPDHPDRGTLTLRFSADPVTLRQWVVTDESGSETTVILNDFASGMALSPSLFSIRAERNRRGLID